MYKNKNNKINFKTFYFSIWRYDYFLYKITSDKILNFLKDFRSDAISGFSGGN